jgi:hypothetical protein
MWLAGGAVIAAHYVVEYHPAALQKGDLHGLGFLQGTWAKAHELRMPSWRKEADNAPPGALPLLLSVWARGSADVECARVRGPAVITTDAGSSQPTPTSQV